MTTPDDQFFKDLEQERTSALVARDIEAISRLHDPDYELITPAGRVFTRAEYIAAIAAEPFYAGWEVGAMRVQAGEDLAVVRYLAELHFPSGRRVRCWHTDVYRKRGETWAAVWSQATEIKSAARDV